MKKHMLFGVASICAFGALAEVGFFQDREVFIREPNYDESKIPAYSLEDPLTFVDGRKVKNAADWAERRREILGIFAKEMFGEEPPRPEAVVAELVDEKNTVDGYAIRRQYRMWFRKDKSGPCVNWIVWVPTFAKKPVPVISFLNYRGNHELVPDADIPVQQGWSRAGENTDGHRCVERTRGIMQDPNGASIFPLGIILARGYAVMSACYCEVSPDPDRNEKDQKYQQNPFAYTGVFGLWGRRDESRTDNITAIGAWAWALSRGLDLAERVPGIDAKRSVVTGCSRLGKAAFLAAARDERFAVCVPNQTGGGGIPLAKRDYREPLLHALVLPRLREVRGVSVEDHAVRPAPARRVHCAARASRRGLWLQMVRHEGRIPLGQGGKPRVDVPWKGRHARRGVAGGLRHIGDRQGSRLRAPQPESRNLRL